ncbi:DUF967 domain-containing protein [Mariannaea sp. PMI_226]|nr:DUF967 domain-containing protein [Mariannaea sp. PMI_226]
MTLIVYKRKTSAAAALAQVQEAVQSTAAPAPIPWPSADVDELKVDGDSFTLESFTTEDAFVLGNLLYARLLPYATAGQPTVISIALANSAHVLYQVVTGPGTAPDNDSWVQRKRNASIRFGCSSWLLNCKYNGDEAKFAAKFAIGEDKKGDYAIHGGCIPIRVKGVEGIVATVIVSGLKQHEDHGVIVDVIKANWE